MSQPEHDLSPRQEPSNPTHEVLRDIIDQLGPEMCADSPEGLYNTDSQVLFHLIVEGVRLYGRTMLLSMGADTDNLKLQEMALLQILDSIHENLSPVTG